MAEGAEVMAGAAGRGVPKAGGRWDVAAGGSEDRPAGAAWRAGAAEVAGVGAGRAPPKPGGRPKPPMPAGRGAVGAGTALAGAAGRGAVGAGTGLAGAAGRKAPGERKAPVAAGRGDGAADCAEPDGWTGGVTCVVGTTMA